MSLLPPFTRILSRRPAQTLAQGLTTHPEFGTPDTALTQQQYDAYLAVLRAWGLHIAELPPDPRFPDGHYVEDDAVIFRDLAFITHPGAPERQAEPDALAQHLHDLHQVRMRGEGAFLEGGDVLFCGDRVLIGLSSRTNRAGAEQLASALRDIQADIRVELVPFRGVLHLKTGMTELAPGVLLQSPEMRTDYQPDFAQVVRLPMTESYAANVLPINGSVLIAAGYPQVAALAEQHYAGAVVALEMSEFKKMDGSLTCLSLRY